jgi:hypothetical protein
VRCHWHQVGIQKIAPGILCPDQIIAKVFQVSVDEIVCEFHIAKKADISLWLCFALQQSPEFLKVDRTIPFATGASSAKTFGGVRRITATEVNCSILKRWQNLKRITMIKGCIPNFYFFHVFILLFDNSK